MSKGQGPDSIARANFLVEIDAFAMDASTATDWPFDTLLAEVSRRRRPCVNAAAHPDLAGHARLARMRRFLEVSHAIRDGMVTYPGLPVPRTDLHHDHASSRARYADQAEFLIANLHLCGNTGTYVDAPVHRYRDGADLAALPLERLADLPIAIVDVQADDGDGPLAIDASAIADRDVTGRAVLFRTGWSRHFGSERYTLDAPFLTAALCNALIGGGAVFVGLDAPNVDDVRDPARPAHTLLLGASVPICEHLTNLGALPSERGRLHAVPIAWVGGASFPVRAYVVLDPDRS